MGERVVVDPAAAAGAAQGATQEPRPAVPLGYGHAESKFAGVDARAAAVVDALLAAVRKLGGWRRVGFAFGLSLVAAGFAYGMAETWHSDEAAFMAGLGAMLVGFTVPVKGLDDAARE